MSGKTKYPMTNDEIAIVSGIQFLEECFEKGERGEIELYEWFRKKRYDIMGYWNMSEEYLTGR